LLILSRDAKVHWNTFEEAKIQIHRSFGSNTNT